MGNIATKDTVTILYDDDAPAPITSSLSFVDNLSAASPTNITRTNSTTAYIDNSSTLFIDNTSNGTGVGVHRLYITDNSITPTATDNFTRVPNGSTSDLSYDFSGSSPSEGSTITLYAYAVDRLSNFDNSSNGYVSTSIIFDNVSPSSSGQPVILVSAGDMVTTDNQTFYTNNTSLSFGNLATTTTDNDTALTYYVSNSDNVTLAAAANYAASPSYTGNTVSNTLYVWAKDSAGNGPGLIDNLTVIIDSAGPSMNDIQLYEGGSDNSTHTDNATVTIEFDNATDGTGVGIRWYYSSTSNTFEDNESLWSNYTGDNGTFEIPNATSMEEQSETVNVWLIDNLTNYTAVAEYDSITISNADPTISSLSITGQNTAGHNVVSSTETSSVSENITVTLSATTIIRYHLTTSQTIETTPTGSSSVWTDSGSPAASFSSEPISFNLSNISLSDNMTFYVWVKDGLET